MYLFMTMVTGSRRGEMCALRWSDINFERLELFVKHSNSRSRIKDTKTHQRRKQAMDVITRAVLVAHRTRAEERCQALGGELARDAFVFSVETAYNCLNRVSWLTSWLQLLSCCIGGPVFMHPPHSGAYRGVSTQNS